MASLGLPAVSAGTKAPVAIAENRRFRRRLRTICAEQRMWGTWGSAGERSNAGAINPALDLATPPPTNTPRRTRHGRRRDQRAPRGTGIATSIIKVVCSNHETRRSRRRCGTPSGRWWTKRSSPTTSTSRRSSSPRSRRSCGLRWVRPHLTPSSIGCVPGVAGQEG